MDVRRLRAIKKKILYITLTAAIVLTAFFAGKSTAKTENVYKEEESNIETMEKAFSQITYWEITNDGLNIYDYDGNLYEWR